MTYTIHVTRTESKAVKVTTAAEIQALHKLGFMTQDAEAEGKGHFVSLCEVCGLPVFSDDEHLRDSEGIYWHEVCPEAENE
ncbi:hypothetical protein [Maridesulfovibrio sp.]|uniref:hypothetical protein n=1 Tax=Maridesulfovibrio sp. TaxID=2795000 RepID=UPI0029C9B9B6|nr:hypothetical protein [Maridesulfovibrio sp.]